MTRRLRRPLLILALAPILGACSPFPQSVNRGGGTTPVSTTPPPGTHTPECSPDSNQAGDTYVVFGHHYHVRRHARGYDERGIASWYGPNFHGKLTSSGSSYDMYAMTAANKVLPLCTWVKVTNLKNGKSAIVQVNDRGPFVANRIIDLSYAAAKSLGVVHNGTALVDVRAIAPPSKSAPADIEQVAKKTTVHKLHHHAEIYVQVGAFTQPSHADRLRARLVLNEVGDVTIQKAKVDGKHYYRVLVGPFDSVDDVDSITSHLDSIGYSDTSVVIQ